MRRVMKQWIVSIKLVWHQHDLNGIDMSIVQLMADRRAVLARIAALQEKLEVESR